LKDPCFVCVSQAEVAMLLDGASYSIHTRARSWKSTVPRVDTPLRQT
jgi:hypothetical protein